MSDPQLPVPEHVAIIMDGNGRWAQTRGLPRFAGHKAGADTVERVVRAAKDLGIQHLTLFAFSTENWKRPEQEVIDLMGLLSQYLRAKTAEMHENGVRLRIIGDRTRLGKEILSLVDYSEALTRNNTDITVYIALSYSGRWDLAQAMRKIAGQIQNNLLKPESITEEVIAQNLTTAGVPDPDLIIRTSGEQRVSNFLLWQGAYSEYYFTEAHWPDFNYDLLAGAVASYQKRERRFGKLPAQAS